MNNEISKPASAIVLLAIVITCLAAGGIGGFATSANVGGWYETIEKPSWNPPGWIFGPVWGTLYVLMAIAAWLVWRSKKTAGKNAALSLFAVQLILNALWSWVFFDWHRIDWAFYEIVALWVILLATVIAFFRVSKAGGWLMIPYLLWVGFASVLTFTIWQLNG